MFTDAYKQLPSKIVSKLYKALQKLNGSNTLHTKTKWELELNSELSVSDWQSMCKNQHTSTSSNGWREFGWKNLIHFFITLLIKSKQLGKQQCCWRLCGHWSAGHLHIFWSCVEIKPFWDMVLQIVEEVLGYGIPSDPLVVYLGLIPEGIAGKEDIYLFKILTLAAKKSHHKELAEKRTS